MMFLKEWQILLVDDDPDVLAVSKLAMKQFDVYGLPIRIHTAASKAEAIEIIQQLTRLKNAIIAMAFIDVVMETDTAGLELCDYIRNTAEDKMMQLYIRTGQPGIAPERSVIDQYDINGYFTKVEMTEDKLYTLVKSACRQVLYMSTSTIIALALNALIDAPTQEHMQQVLKYFIHGLQHSVSGEKLDVADVQVSVMVDGVLIAGDMNSQALALDALPGYSFGGEDKVVTNSQGYTLTKIGATPTTSEVLFFGKTTMELPYNIAKIDHRFVKSVASLWKQREAIKVT
jgi:CheY-like chemotaxis protein